MGLYLCVFEDDVSDREIDGVEIGAYDDFHAFRDAVAQVESRGWGSQFPVLMLHSDCDGEWSGGELFGLHAELAAIKTAFARHQAPDYGPGWQRELASRSGHHPVCLTDFFIDVDGEPLIERLASLVEVALRHERPITFA